MIWMHDDDLPVLLLRIVISLRRVYSFQRSASESQVPFVMQTLQFKLTFEEDPMFMLRMLRVRDQSSIRVLQMCRNWRPLCSCMLDGPLRTAQSPYSTMLVLVAGEYSTRQNYTTAINPSSRHALSSLGWGDQILMSLLQWTFPSGDAVNGNWTWTFLVLIPFMNVLCCFTCYLPSEPHPRV